MEALPRPHYVTMRPGLRRCSPGPPTGARGRGQPRGGGRGAGAEGRGARRGLTAGTGARPPLPGLREPPRPPAASRPAPDPQPASTAPPGYDPPRPPRGAPRAAHARAAPPPRPRPPPPRARAGPRTCSFFTFGSCTSVAFAALQLAFPSPPLLLFAPASPFLLRPPPPPGSLTPPEKKSPLTVIPASTAATSLVPKPFQGFSLSEEKRREKGGNGTWARSWETAVLQEPLAEWGFFCCWHSLQLPIFPACTPHPTPPLAHPRGFHRGKKGKGGCPECSVPKSGRCMEETLV